MFVLGGVIRNVVSKFSSPKTKNPIDTVDSVVPMSNGYSEGLAVRDLKAAKMEPIEVANFPT